MKKSSILAICFVFCIVFMCILSGCSSKKVRITEFLHTYGEVTAEKMYNETSFKAIGGSFCDYDYKIENVDIKSINSKEVGGSIVHYVKVKMSYRFSNKHNKAKDIPILYDRYMALAIVEDGFKKMMVYPSGSREVYVAGFSKEMMSELFRDQISSGEALIN